MPESADEIPLDGDTIRLGFMVTSPRARGALKGPFVVRCDSDLLGIVAGGFRKDLRRAESDKRVNLRGSVKTKKA